MHIRINYTILIVLLLQNFIMTFPLTKGNLPSKEINKKGDGYGYFPYFSQMHLAL